MGDVGKRYSDGSILWKCQCNCKDKTITFVVTNKLTGGWTQSCGCLRKENSKASLMKNAKYPRRLYKIWNNMKRRIFNEDEISYKYYGGRGIKICDEWVGDYDKFKEWALNNGYSDDLSIDRIDVNGNYEPSNCRWATAKEQANNRTNTIYLTYKNKTLTLTEWSEKTGLNTQLIWDRINRGWEVEPALTTEPEDIGAIKIEFKGLIKSLREWSEYTGIDLSILQTRHDRRWIIEKMLTTKPREHIRLEYNGVSKTFSEWGEDLGIQWKTLWTRYNRGWTVEEILTTPIGQKRKIIKGEIE